MSRKPRVLREASLASSLVSEGGRSLPASKEREGERRCGPEQAQLSPSLVFLEHFSCSGLIDRKRKSKGERKIGGKRNTERLNFLLAIFLNLSLQIIYLNIWKCTKFLVFLDLHPVSRADVQMVQSTIYNQHPGHQM